MGYRRTVSVAAVHARNDDALVMLGLGAAAAGTYIVDDAVIAADRIAVYGMVHGAVADAAVVHAADDGLKGLEIMRRIAIHLHIADMAGIREIMIRTLDLDLFCGGNRIVYGNMEAVRIIIAIGDARILP